MTQDSRLSDYGRPIAEYRGQGTLHWATSPPQQVSFDAGQLNDGDIVILCSLPLPLTEVLIRYFHGGDDEECTRFEGVTAEGWPVKAVGGLTSVNYVPQTKDPGAYTALRARELQVTFSAEPVVQHRLGLVNFHLSGTHPVTIRRTHSQQLPDYTQGLPVELRVGDRRVNATIVPVSNATNLHRQLITSKDFRVLSEAVVPVDNEHDGAEFRRALTDLCLVLSVARGTRVQWVYREDWSVATLVRKSHQSYLTKPYCPLAPFPPNYEHAETTRRFIEGALNRLPTLSAFQLEQGTVAAYLDAKAEGDYTQTRGAKLAVAIEKLKAVFLKVPDCGINEFVVVDKSEFKKLIPQMSAALKSVLTDLSPDDVQQIAGDSKLLMLNRRSFRSVVKALCRYAGFAPHKDEFELFLKSRDYLVHRGAFYCDAAEPEDRAKVPPLPDATKEFFFLVSFLDRLFLKLLNYSGPHTDWRKLQRQVLPRQELSSELP